MSSRPYVLPLVCLGLVAISACIPLWAAETKDDMAPLERELAVQVQRHQEGKGLSDKDWRTFDETVRTYWKLLRKRWPKGPDEARARLSYMRLRQWAEVCATAAPESAQADQERLRKLIRAADLYLEAGADEGPWHDRLDEAAQQIKVDQPEQAVMTLRDLPDMPSDELAARKHALLAIALAKAGRPEEATKSFGDFVARFPKHPFVVHALYYGALGSIIRQDYDAALVKLRRVLEVTKEEWFRREAERIVRRVEESLHSKRETDVVSFF